MLFKFDADAELGAQLLAEMRRRNLSRAELLRQACIKLLADSDRERIEALEDLAQQHGRRIARLEAAARPARGGSARA